MAPSRRETEAYIKTLATPPPAGSPYALPLPGTERPNRTAVYRHWRFQKGPLLETFSPEHQTLHDLFESSAAAYPGKDCLGWRPWNPVSKTYEPKYTWISYGQVAERRKNFGAGIVELHKRVGVTDDKYGVGLWSQNRAEWQISGEPTLSYLSPRLADRIPQSWPWSPSPSGPSPSTRPSAPRRASTSSTTAASRPSSARSTTSRPC